MPAQSATSSAAGTPFKNIFDHACAAWMAERLAAAEPLFDAKLFLAKATAGLDELELKARVERFATTAAGLMPDNVPRTLSGVVRALGPEQQPKSDEDFGDFRVMPFARMVSLVGLAHPEPALDALEAVTKRFSAEFDIRHFLVHHPELTLKRLHFWAQLSDWRVRRLASEGSRPRLPWGLRLQQFVRDPAPVLEVLDRLKHDRNSAVRRSVANNLNDISKDHPDLVVEVLQRWQSERPLDPKLIRHALRGLIKQGHRGALALVGIDSEGIARLDGFALSASSAPIGGEIGFSAVIANAGAAAATFSIDYAVHHRRADGRLSPKIYKLTRRKLAPGEICRFDKRHPLKLVTVRTYRPGTHRIEILVNGQPLGGAEFELLPA